jgi:hypothetical protein
MSAAAAPQAPAPPRPAAYVWAAIAAAVTFGLAEAATLAFRRFLLHEFIWAGRDVVWAAPVSYLLACAAAARTERALAYM